MKKLTALLLALIMVLAMNASALAATLSGGKAESTTGMSDVNFTVDFLADSSVESPAVTFNFSIDEGAGRAAVPAVAADPSAEPPVAASAAKPAITAGVEGGAFFGSIADKKYTTTVTFAKGDNAQKTPTIVFDTSVFLTPGIYRYVLTHENLSADQTAAGVSRGDTYKDLILDVYVSNNTNGSARIVTGAVLHEDAEAQNDSAKKVTGYTDKYTVSVPGNPGDPNDDKPTSYDVEITKTTTGVAGDPNQEFVFTINIPAIPDGDGVSVDGVEVDVVRTGGIGGTDKDVAKITLSKANPQTISVTLKNESSYKLQGVPANFKLSVSENPLDYTPSFKVTDMEMDENNGTTADAGTREVKTTGGKIAFTNNRDMISPTGVVLRIAPYAIMLGAGVVLFIILKSRKNKDVEEA